MKCILFCFAFALLASTAFGQELVAYARMYGLNGSNIEGYVKFTAVNETHTRVEVEITGIEVNPSDYHGIHVHALGDLAGDLVTGSAVGSHFVGNGSSNHGCPESEQRHAGDMGNFKATEGKISDSRELDLLPLTGPNSIIGRAVVLHAEEDDCADAGSAGARLAVGVIGLAQNSTAKLNNIQTVKATCYLTPTANNNATGKFYFEQFDNGTVAVYGEVYGLEMESLHGIHIHTWGDLSSASGSAAGSHWDPKNTAHHAWPHHLPRHRGDLGNIAFYDNTGVAYYYEEFNSDTELSVLGIETESVIGRAMILHAKPDDGCTQPVGEAGDRLAQCVIGYADFDELPKPPFVIPPQTQAECYPPEDIMPLDDNNPSLGSHVTASILAIFALVAMLAFTA